MTHPYRTPPLPPSWAWADELDAAPLAPVPLSGAALAALWGSAASTALTPPRFPRRGAGTSSGGPR